MKEINARIKAIREEKGMSQQELAIRSGFKSRSTINKIEAGTREVTLAAGIKIAEALQVDPDYLIFGDLDHKRVLNQITEFTRLFDQLSAEDQKKVLLDLVAKYADRAVER